RQLAVAALGKIKEPADVILPVLLKMMNDKNHRVRWESTLRLREFAQFSETIVPALAAALEDKSEEVRRGARYSLIEIGKPSVPVLKKALEHEDREVRMLATYALAQLDEPVPVSLLIETLEYGDVIIRERIAPVVGKMGESASDAVPVLIKIMANRREQSLWPAVDALIKIGKPAVPALIEALKDPRIYSSAAYALGHIGEPARDAIPELTKLMESRFLFSINSLEYQSTLEKAKFPKPMRREFERNGIHLSQTVRARIVEAGSRWRIIDYKVSRYRVTKVGNRLDVYKDDDGARQNASKALARIGEPAVPALIDVLKSDNKEARDSAADALAMIGEPAIPDLIETLTDDDGEIRKIALRALRGTDAPYESAAPMLKEAFSGKSIETHSYEAVQQLIQYFTSLQGQYDEIRRLYLSERYDRAKKLLIRILESAPDGQVSFYQDGNYFKVAPAALDMLGKISLKEENVPAAMSYFRKMVEYSDDFFLGPTDGDQFYGGPAAAQGMIEQIWVLMNIEQEYDAAMELAYLLIDGYDGVVKPCIEFCGNYEQAAAYSIMECLEKKDAPLAEWETEFRKIINKTRNKYLQANLLLDLGRKNTELDETTHAIQIYREIIQQYPELYLSSEAEVHLRVYSLEAFRELLDIFKNQKDSEEQMQKVEEEMKEHYERVYQILIEVPDDGRGLVRGLERRFGTR
ncbi:HEAT repeat domain-containing protein, partial [Candidatus Poribacteria bacterium]